MLRQSKNERNRKTEDMKRGAAEASPSLRDHREPRSSSERNDIRPISGLNRYRLNDLYERSSI